MAKKRERDPLKAIKVDMGGGPDPMHPVWSACDNLVEAWEKLEGGRNHSVSAIEHWLAVHMSPAINRARKALGRKAPNE